MEGGGLKSGGDVAKPLINAEIRREDEKEYISSGGSEDYAADSKRKEIRFKASHALLVAFLAFFILLHALGIYLFTNGFLLTRLVLDHKSQCAVSPIASHGSFQAGSSIDGCWHPKTFDKAVVLIIDALRYDFTVPYEPATSNEKPKLYHNSIPFLYQTSIRHPRNAVLRPFIADPPTTTLQRLKGLTTGSLPTFIDAGSNFAGTAIEEDNLVIQLRNAGKNVVHLGDDTWHSLFPGYFDANLTRAYDSFVTEDLHTVDNGVIDHLIPLMHPSNSSQWDIIFAHCLGVDHVGHTSGPDHFTMADKLQQMDEFIRQIVGLVDENTLLVIMGDHGMDSKGNHGGESEDEVEAALWMYSKRDVFGRSSPEHVTPPATAKDRPVFQIDLVPTLALLLGIPIPFNNLGAPIEEAFVGVTGDNGKNLALTNRITAAQIHRYQQEYALVREPEPVAFAPPIQLWNSALQAWDHEMAFTAEPSKQQWDVLVKAFTAYERTHLKVCKDLWATFDLVSMSLGVGITLFTLLLVFVYARRLGGDVSQLNAPLLVRGIVSLAGGTASGWILALAQPTLGFNRTVAFSAALSSCVTLSWTFWSAKESVSGHLPRSLWSWTCIIFVLLLSAGFGSNSYTIWEDEILLFFLITFGVLMLTQSFRLRSARDRKAGLINALIFLIAIRLTSLSRLCREEQMGICKQTFGASETSSTSAPWQLGLSYMIAIFFPSVIRMYYERTQSYTASAPLWVGIVFRMSLLLIAVYWTLDAANEGQWFDISKELLKSVRTYIAQLVLLISAGAGTATFAWQAPLITIDTFTPPARASSKAKALKGFAAALPSPEIATSQTRILVEGTANIYGSHYAMLLFTFTLLPLLLLQKPMGQAALALTTIAIFSLLELLHLLKQPTSLTPSSHPLNRNRGGTSISPVGPTILALLAHFAYFKTGHQATLASIQWSSAYIPLRNLRYPWSPLFVILNTFAGQILCAAAVPCVVLWRRPYKFAPDSTWSSGTNTTVFSRPEGTTSTQLQSCKIHPSMAGITQGNILAPPPPVAIDRREFERRSILTDLAEAHFTHILVYSVINFATTMFAGHLRRHLMLYRVFCPRWMLGVAGMMIAEIVGVIVGVGGVRWTVGSLAVLFGW